MREHLEDMRLFCYVSSVAHFNCLHQWKLKVAMGMSWWSGTPQLTNHVLVDIFAMYVAS